MLAKQLSVLFPGEVDELALFSRIAFTGCAVMLPLTLLLEGKSVNRQISSTVTITSLNLLCLEERAEEAGEDPHHGEGA